jgi:hypothetical protein
VAKKKFREFFFILEKIPKNGGRGNAKVLKTIKLNKNLMSKI